MSRSASAAAAAMRAATAARWAAICSGCTSGGTSGTVERGASGACDRHRSTPVGRQLVNRYRQLAKRFDHARSERECWRERRRRLVPNRLRPLVELVGVGRRRAAVVGVVYSSSSSLTLASDEAGAFCGRTVRARRTRGAPPGTFLYSPFTCCLCHNSYCSATQPAGDGGCAP